MLTNSETLLPQILRPKGTVRRNDYIFIKYNIKLIWLHGKPRRAAGQHHTAPACLSSPRTKFSEGNP